MNLFVTGTDTNIGKTLVSASICLKLGYKYWKPIQSGLHPQPDREWVAERIGHHQTLPECYKLTQPLSPELAARMDQVEISVESILKSAPSQNTVIEGAGGLLVPIHRQAFIIDLIKPLNCKTILVARSSLGTINHTLLSIEALRKRGIEPLGVVTIGEFNEENNWAISNFGSVSILGSIPILETLDREHLIKASQLLRLEIK